MKGKIVLFTILFVTAFFNHSFSQHTHAEWAKHIVAQENTSFLNIISDGEALIANGYWFLEAEYDGVELEYHIGANGLIVKKDSEGNIIWHATITGDDFNYFFDIAFDSENNIIAAGWSNANDYIEVNGEIVYEPDMEWTSRGVVAKFSGEDGSLIWFKVVNPTEAYYNLLLNRVAVDQDDNVYISGYSNTDFEIDGVEFPYTQTGWGSLSFIAKLDPDGTIEWGKQFHFLQQGNAGWSIPRKLKVRNEEVYFAFQYSKPVFAGEELLPYEGNGDFDWIGLVKLSREDGEVLNTNAFGSESDQGIASLEFDNNGNILVAGFFSSESDFSIDGVYPRWYGVEDGYVAKLNSEFELIWLQSMGSEFSSRCFNLNVTPDDRIFVGGGFDSYTPLFFEGHKLIDEERPTNSLAMFQVVLTKDGSFEKAFALHGEDIYSIVEFKDAVVLENDVVMAVGQSVDYVSFVEGEEFFSDHWAGFFIKWDLSKEFYKVFFDVTDEEGNLLEDAIVTLEGTSNPFNNHSFYQLDPGAYGYTISLEGYHDATGDVVVTDQDVFVTVTLVSITSNIGTIDSPFINVFPNPAKTSITIASDVIFEEIRIYNMLGKEVFFQQFHTNSAQINVEGLSEGLHIVLIRSQNGISTQKIHIVK